MEATASTQRTTPSSRQGQLLCAWKEEVVVRDMSGRLEIVRYRDSSSRSTAIRVRRPRFRHQELSYCNKAAHTRSTVRQSQDMTNRTHPRHEYPQTKRYLHVRSRSQQPPYPNTPAPDQHLSTPMPVSPTTLECGEGKGLSHFRHRVGVFFVVDGGSFLVVLQGQLSGGIKGSGRFCGFTFRRCVCVWSVFTKCKPWGMRSSALSALLVVWIVAHANRPD